MAAVLGVTAPATAVAPAKTALSPEQIEKTRKAAQDFEAMALGEMLQPMFSTVDTSKGLFGGGKGETRRHRHRRFGHAGNVANAGDQK
jgi:hypothetical protein